MSSVKIEYELVKSVLHLLWMIEHGTEAKGSEIGESIGTILVWLLWSIKLNVFLVQ